MEAASTFSGMRRYTEARHFFEMALNILPNNPFARFLFGFNFFGKTGDAAALRKQLDVVAQQGPDAERTVAFPLLYCSWMQRDRAAAEKAVALIPAEGIANSFDEAAIPREYCVGRTAWLFGDKAIGADGARIRTGDFRAHYPRTARLSAGVGISRPNRCHAWPVQRSDPGRKTRL